jgi:CubicO group peptidase (beta-lactamase class C family)
MGNGSCFSTAPDMLKFCDDLLKREKFPKAYYDVQFTACFDKGGHRRSFGWDMTAETSTFAVWTKTNFSDSAICHTGWTGSAIAVDPNRCFAGVVLASQQAGKSMTMGPRMGLLELMASVSNGECSETFKSKEAMK